jgi:CubicO group peptidase (beta-lactamase class C family)
VRQLLNHTGGTGDIFGPEFEAHRTTLKDNGDYLKLYGSRGLDHAPGVEDRYSNYGFVLLGAVIERVSGMSYYDCVARHVFEPAGMRATGSPPEDADVPARVAPYTKLNGRLVDARDTPPYLAYRGMAAGGGLSSVGDLLRFAQALEGRKLISPSLVREATTPQNNGRWYGYGFMVLCADGLLRQYGHEGGAPGENADLRIFPALGVVIVALSNMSPPEADRLADFYALRMPANP